MSTHKHFEKLSCIVLAVCILLSVLMMHAESLGVRRAESIMGYEEKLFTQDKVHTIDIRMDDWDGFMEVCENEEYAVCSVIIDGEAIKNVGIRAKGNTSLSSVSQYGNDRYSFKIEFDHYDNTKTYYGLDKLSLNNLIQDNTYMKDYLVYSMMGEFGVASPLCSYVYLTVNGEDFGLYLAVEAIEESFLQRNYGRNYGELYKPDSMDMGGGRGNGKSFDQEAFFGGFTEGNEVQGTADQSMQGDPTERFSEEGNIFQSFGNMMGGFGMGSSATKLQYIDDDPDSYSVIFDSAKTDITQNDKIRLISALQALSTGDAETSLDMDAVLRYFTVHNFVCNADSYTGTIIHNYYLYEKDGKLSMLPWDYNLAFGGMNGGDATQTVNTPILSPVSGGTGEDRPMIAWIFASEEMTALYETYISDFISMYFESGIFEEKMEETRSLIAPFVEKDPTKFCTYEEFEAGVSALRQFCILRAESVRKQCNGEIGKTSESQNSETFVSADDLNLSDMGSMGGFGGGRNDFGELGDFEGLGNFKPENMPQAPSEEGGTVFPNENGTEFPSISEQGAFHTEGMPSLPSDLSSSQAPQEGMEEMPSENGASSRPSDGFTRPNGMTGGFEGGLTPSDNTPQQDIQALPLLILSVGILLLGILCAILFRGKTL